MSERPSGAPRPSCARSVLQPTSAEREDDERHEPHQGDETAQRSHERHAHLSTRPSRSSRRGCRRRRRWFRDSSADTRARRRSRWRSACRSGAASRGRTAASAFSGSRRTARCSSAMVRSSVALADPEPACRTSCWKRRSACSCRARERIAAGSEPSAISSKVSSSFASCSAGGSKRFGSPATRKRCTPCRARATRTSSLAARTVRDRATGSHVSGSPTGCREKCAIATSVRVGLSPPGEDVAAEEREHTGKEDERDRAGDVCRDPGPAHAVLQRRLLPAYSFAARPTRSNASRRTSQIGKLATTLCRSALPAFFSSDVSETNALAGRRPAKRPSASSFGYSGRMRRPIPSSPVAAELVREHRDVGARVLQVADEESRAAARPLDDLAGESQALPDARAAEERARPRRGRAEERSLRAEEAQHRPDLVPPRPGGRSSYACSSNATSPRRWSLSASVRRSVASLTFARGSTLADRSITTIPLPPAAK